MRRIATASPLLCAFPCLVSMVMTPPSSPSGACTRFCGSGSDATIGVIKDRRAGTYTAMLSVLGFVLQILPALDQGNGEVIQLGWKSPAVHEALDLCLACKGCSSDCPTGVDMATYKAEMLHQTYRRRLRPRSHYALGQLPRWARLLQLDTLRTGTR